MMTTELQEIRNVFRGLETLYQTYLPKVDPALIHGLLVREQEKAERAPNNQFDPIYEDTTSLFPEVSV